MQGKSLEEEFIGKEGSSPREKHNQLVDLTFALLQTEQVVVEFMEGQKSHASLLQSQSLNFLNNLEFSELSDDYLRKSLQVLCLAQMLQEQS